MRWIQVSKQQHTHTTLTTPPLHHSTTPPLHHSTTHHSPPLTTHHHSTTHHSPPTLTTHSPIQLNGWATTINWKRVLQPAFANAVSDFRRRAEASRNSIVSSSSGSGGSGSSAASSSSGRSAAEPYLHAGPGPVPLRGGPSWPCTSCTIWAMFRPRAVRASAQPHSMHSSTATPRSPPSLSPAAHTGATARARLLADRAELKARR